MNSKFLKIPSVIMMMTLTITSYANTHTKYNSSVRCPLINVIQQQSKNIDAISGPYSSKTNFFVTASNNFFDNNKSWTIFASVPAKSESEAIENGKVIVKNISIRKQEMAVSITDNYFICYYLPGNVYAIS